MVDAPMQRASFRHIGESTEAEWASLRQREEAFARAMPARVLAHFAQLDDFDMGFAVSRSVHCLQAATLAAEDGRDDEYVVCALLHDLGDLLGIHHHASFAAEILRPYVREDYHWMVAHHDVFQGYYFWHRLGGDRNARERFRDHPLFDLTAEFCEKYDAPAFDPDATYLPLDEFRPLVERVMSAPRDA